MSMGYITAHSYKQTDERKCRFIEEGAYCISGGCAIEDGIERVYLFATDAFLEHLALNQFLIHHEIDSITGSFTHEGYTLALEDAGNPMLRVYLPDGIKGTVIHRIRIRLRL